ncbi:MAG TPA: hypothetical protein VJ506_03640 [Candidatus Limnocylindrales bacterium]|nr:hypothetical protein [Candidatus Limnocylindrales bacterium]
MERRWSRLAAVGGATLALALGAQVVSAQRAPNLLEFGTMASLPSSLTGTQSASPLRGVNGGGLPWMLTSGRGELSTSGHLEIKVTGLVLAAGPNAGSNPIASFRGLVSCVRSDGTFSNVLTDPFPATTGPASGGGGNAEIEADVSLPSPCLAPIVFVTSPGGAWFAVTGA